MAEKNFKEELKDAWTKEPTAKDKRNGWIMLGVVAVIVIVWILVSGGGDQSAARPEAKEGLTEANKNVVRHIANASFAGDLCEEYIANPLMSLLVLEANGIELVSIKEGGRYHQIWQDQVRENTQTVLNTSVESFCPTAWYLYGENGLNVPGLLVKN